MAGWLQLLRKARAKRAPSPRIASLARLHARTLHAAHAYITRPALPLSFLSTVCPVCCLVDAKTCARHPTAAAAAAADTVAASVCAYMGTSTNTNTSTSTSMTTHCRRPASERARAARRAGGAAEANERVLHAPQHALSSPNKPEPEPVLCPRRPVLRVPPRMCPMRPPHPPCHLTRRSMRARKRFVPQAQHADRTALMHPASRFPRPRPEQLSLLRSHLCPWSCCAAVLPALDGPHPTPAVVRADVPRIHAGRIDR